MSWLQLYDGAVSLYQPSFVFLHTPCVAPEFQPSTGAKYGFLLFCMSSHLRPPTPFCLDLGFVESQFHSLLGDACKSSKLVPTSTTSVYGRLTSGSALIHIGRRVMGSQRNSCVPRHFTPSRFRHGDRSMSPAGALTLLPTESLVLRLVLHFDGISLGGHAFFPWR